MSRIHKKRFQQKHNTTNDSLSAHHLSADSNSHHNENSKSSRNNSRNLLDSRQQSLPNSLRDQPGKNATLC